MYCMQSLHVHAYVCTVCSLYMYMHMYVLYVVSTCTSICMYCMQSLHVHAYVCTVCSLYMYMHMYIHVVHAHVSRYVPLYIRTCM